MEWVRREPGYALLGAAGAYLLLLLILLLVLIRFTVLTRRQARLLRGTDGQSLERMLLEQVDTTLEVRDRISQAARTSEENAEAIHSCLQRIGIVRFDAFQGVGGEQSFALAILDARSNGLVVSGLYSRNDMRVYAKPVISGNSPLSLTEEERQAITSAVTGGPVTQHPGRAAGGRR